MEKDYSSLDESTSPIQEVLRELRQFAGTVGDPEMGGMIQVEQVSLDTPVELDVHVDESGKVTLGTCSRHTSADLSFEPVMHQMRMVIQKQPSTID